jgi:hypothetical protein
LPCSALAWSTNCPPFGLVAGVAIDTLQPNLRGSGLTLVDALDLGRVERIDLRAALAVVLETHPVSQRREIGEPLFQCIDPGDLGLPPV